jgi:hypothetical protein
MRKGGEVNSSALRATCEAIGLIQFSLFWLMGLISLSVMISVSAQGAPTKLDNVTSYADSNGGNVSVFVAARGKDDGSAAQTEIVNIESNGQVDQVQAFPNPNIGVEILGGLALLVWVQRLRNSAIL